MRARLIEIELCWIEVHCGQCSSTTLFPVRLLIRKRGRDPQLGTVLSRMRCKRCGVPPAAAWLSETQHRKSSNGVPPGWSVPLLPLTK